MTCEQIAQLLPDYFVRALSADKLTTIDRHLDQCSECREQVAIWEKLSLLPEEQPSPMLRQRFEAMLNAYEEGRWEKAKLQSAREENRAHWNVWNWMRAPVAQVAFALIFLAAGFLAGKHLKSDSGNAQELQALHSELRSTRQLVVLSMLQQQSATERLQGVSFSTQVGRPDPEILAALMHTLRFDTSVDVRLAALDALRHYGDRSEVRTGLMDALQAQQSPLVQIALIDLLVELRDADAVQRLKNLQQTPNLNPAVRQRTEWGLRQLSHG